MTPIKYIPTRAELARLDARYFPPDKINVRKDLAAAWRWVRGEIKLFAFFVLLPAFALGLTAFVALSLFSLMPK